MMWLWLFAVSTLLQNPSQAYSVYGDDNRQNIEEVRDVQIKELSRSIGLMTTLNKVEYQETTQSFTEKKLTPKKRKLFQPEIIDQTHYSEEKKMGFCTSFLITPDTMMAAGHCLDDLVDCQRTVILFDYTDSSQSAWDKDHSRRCTGIVALKHTPPTKKKLFKKLPAPTPEDDIEYAIFKLDRPVMDRTPLVISSSVTFPRAHTQVGMVGHPRGRTMKFADHAQIFGRDGHLFTTNLDGFHGNSGSPVFDMATKQVIGLYLNGRSDDDDEDVGTKFHPVEIRHDLAFEENNPGEKALALSEIKSVMDSALGITGALTSTR